MSKIFLLIAAFFVIILPILINPSSAFAVETCLNSGITYSPTQFLENSSIITLNFKINNPNTLNFLKGKSVRLNFGTGIFGGQTSLSVPTTINGNSFSLSLTDKTLREVSPHSGALVYTDTNKEVCSQINYTVNRISLACTLVTDNNVAPGGDLPFKFVGIPNTAYKIQYQGFAPIIGSVTTDSNGQGTYTITSIKKADGTQYQNGDTFSITLTDQPSSKSICSSNTIKVSITAPPPPPLPAGPVIPTNSNSITSATNCTPGVDCTSSDVTSAAGKQCDTKSGEDVESGGDGVKTAIGCIPTEPKALIEGLLKYSFGIGGGVAFLLMVLGAFGMITSAGNPETLKAGQERFYAAIIGLLFILLSVLLLKIIGVDLLNFGQFFGG